MGASDTFTSLCKIKHKWASSADAGVSVDYQFNDKLSVDAQVLKWRRL